MIVLRFLACTALLIVGWMSIVQAGDGALSPDQMIVLFLKVITYDQSFEFDSTKTVTVYLPYERSNAASFEQFRTAQKFFDRNKELSVEGAHVRFVPFPIDEAASSLTGRGASNYSLLLMTNLAKETVQGLLDKAFGMELRSFSLDPDLVPLGVAVSARAGDK
ncbi:MAG: hypothetical protein NTW07_09715, partial [candidate division Zixibacteria bacterium]|nr:hypothetical protein [candidate division Zixibacteria bacterium]